VLAWMKATGPVAERVNPNGGAIALGHTTGCGGGLGTGTILERVH